SKYKRKNQEINAIKIKVKENKIDQHLVMISHDNRYIKATDILGSTTIIWDMLTGERCDDVNEESIVWLEKKVYEKDNYDTSLNIVFSGKELYHVSLCDSALSYSIKNRFCNRPQIPTLYL